MKLPQNRFKARLKSGEQQIGIWNTIPDPSVVEALAGAGFDWLLIDTEHTAVEVSSVLPLLQAAAPHPSACVVRPVENNVALIKRHLDQGAQTILLPQIQSRAEAEAAVSAALYPPAGIRGVAGTMRAAGYGRIRDYTVSANDEICVLLQIESAQGLDRLEEIATTPGVDGIFIGPSDLAASLGYPGRSGHPDVRTAVLRAISQLKDLGVPSGLLTLEKSFAEDCMAAGSTFTAVGLDMHILVGAVDRLASDFNRAS